MPAKPIFIGGTGSHAGKSWVTTAICRYLYRMGHRVAPFKAQNMSNNSMVCGDGAEIGRAQAAQAEACGLEPLVDMNPILLKPTGSLGCQVVLNGKPWRNLKAAEYYEHFDFLLERVVESYRRLENRFDFIVIEGAGSLTELNLKTRDLVNLGLARRLNAPSILVADIDRGGVFASVIGTFHLLDEEESGLVRAFLINRFRGDPHLFKDGVQILEEKSGRPCLGVFPYIDDVYLDAEDSVYLETAPMQSSVAVIRLPHISNFTDFRLFPGARFLSRPATEQFDVIFIPGTKNTIDDMTWLRETGFEKWMVDEAQRGTKIVGICGGFQMLGEWIVDPHGVESSKRSVRGLGLLKTQTELAQEKIARVVSARTSEGSAFRAYEIHMGKTTGIDAYHRFATVEYGMREGVLNGNIVGTYLHGAFEDKAVVKEILGIDVTANSKETHYDRLADWFAAHVDHDLFAKEFLVQSVVT